MSNSGGVYTFSKTAAANASADSTQNWAEGMAPSAVNDSARAMMASIAKWRDDISGALVTSGTAQNYIVASNQQFDTLADFDGQLIAFTPHATNTGSPVTVTVDGFANIPLRLAPNVEIPIGGLIAGVPQTATYNRTDAALYLRNNTILSAGQVATSNIAANAVTYAKMQPVTNNRLLGNVSGSTAAPEEITIGSGLLVNGTTLSAPALPVPGGFKNLSIKVASNTTVAVAADFVTTTDGTNFQTTALSGTINLGTNGAANALDTGTIAIDTWYAIWAIAKADGTTAALASTSATAPTLPSGYTYKARIGWVRTIHASATLLGTWQLGRDAQYVVGLAQTSITPNMAIGPAGTYSVLTPSYAAVVVSNFVPATASKIKVIAAAQYNNNAAAGVLVAPNGSYSGPDTTNPPLYNSNVAGGGGGVINISVFEILLESNSIYWAASANGGAINCLGWTDNL